MYDEPRNPDVKDADDAWAGLLEIALRIPLDDEEKPTPRNRRTRKRRAHHRAEGSDRV